LSIGAFLRFFRLGEGGFGCPSASGNVRSMLHSWWHFFYVAWDPAGTYMHDKTPLAYWLDTISAYVFGFNGFALMLPQALSGILGLMLLYHLVMRLDGRKFVALLSMAVMAFLPVSVLVSRSNKVDEHLVTLVLATACLISEFTRTRKSRYLFSAAIAGGLAFNVKGLALLIMAPSLLILLFRVNPQDQPLSLRKLILPAMVYLAVSLSWMIAVELTPKDKRPKVLNSEDNSVIQLMVGHNGLARISSSTGFDPATALTSSIPTSIPIGVLYGGARGATRLLGEFPGGMIAFLYPLVLAGVLLVLAERHTLSPRINAVFWLVWLTLGSIAFSFSRMGSPHYLELITAPLSALTGTALAASFTSTGWRRLIACLGLAGSAIWILVEYHSFFLVGTWIQMAAWSTLAGLMMTGAFHIINRPKGKRDYMAASTVAFLCIPLLFSTACMLTRPVEGVLPGVTFLELKRIGEGNPAWSSTANRYASGRIDELAPALKYMATTEPHIKYLVAAPLFSTCSAIVTMQDRSALPIYNEFIRTFANTATDLEQHLQSGELRFMLIQRKTIGFYPPDLKQLIEKGTDISQASGLDIDGDWRLLDFRTSFN